MLIEVGGLDAFTVTVQDQTDVPILMRAYDDRPAVIAATDFVSIASDGVLRGVAALQHAELRYERANGAHKVFHAGRLALVVIVGFGVFVLTNDSTGPVAAGASIGFSMWLASAVYTAFVGSPRNAGSLSTVDQTAVELAGNPTLVIDALLSIDGWRTAARRNRSFVARIAHRITTPIRPNWHERERAEALRTPA